MYTLTASIIKLAREYIPDKKTRNKVVRGEDLGYTSTPTGTRGTFYLKHSPTGSVWFYIEPYTYSQTASLKIAATGAKVFMWAPATLSCIFSNGDIDVAHRPGKFKNVLVDYEYDERQLYSFSDTELSNKLSLAISWLNNSYDFSFTYSGTGATFLPVVSTDDEMEIIAKSLAIITRNSFVEEQKKVGLGVKFKGPMQSIDTSLQLKDYQETTNKLIKDVEKLFDKNKKANLPTGNVIDVYDEEVVED